MIHWRLLLVALLYTCNAFTIVPASIVKESSSDQMRSNILKCSVNSDAGALSGTKKRALRALAGELKSKGALHTLQLGASLETPNFIAQLEDSLRAFELVNVKSLTVEKKAMCKTIADSLSAKTKSQVVQVVGHTFLLYRKRRSGEEASAESVDIQRKLKIREENISNEAKHDSKRFY